MEAERLSKLLKVSQVTYPLLPMMGLPQSTENPPKGRHEDRHSSDLTASP
jgi:hypothetical protein